MIVERVILVVVAHNGIVDIIDMFFFVIVIAVATAVRELRT